MPARAGRLGLIATALAMGAIALVACTVSPASSPNGSSNVANFITPDTAQFTPTPQFPPFTIGAQVIPFSPNPTGTITIYVWCRVQDVTMQTPAQPPPAGLQVRVAIGPPVNTNLTGNTDAQGLVAIPYVLNDQNVGQPVDVYVTATWKNVLYTARAFFTTGPTTPPTPTPLPTVNPAASPTVTATP
ncbi:MAG TPA: hypothetical protein VIG30_08570 [Ktedonobacterales bacterium]|jgi:hypothetical protein